MKKGIKVLGYSTTLWNRYAKDRDDIRVIGKVAKKYFVEKVSAEFNEIKKHVREGVAETTDKVEVKFANSKVGTLFVLDEKQELLKKIE